MNGAGDSRRSGSIAAPLRNRKVDDASDGCIQLPGAGGGINLYYGGADRSAATVRSKIRASIEDSVVVQALDRRSSPAWARVITDRRSGLTREVTVNPVSWARVNWEPKPSACSW